MIGVLANRPPYVSSNTDLLSMTIDGAEEDPDDPLDDAERLQGEVSGHFHLQPVGLIKPHCSTTAVLYYSS